MPDIARRLAFEALARVDERGELARDALDGLAARVRPSPRDRDLAAEIALGVLRREDTLDAILALRLRRPVARQEPDVLRVLRIGAYQILLLDRVPPHAAISTAVDLVREVGHDGASGAVNAVLRGVEQLVEGDVAGDGSDPRRTFPRGDGTSIVLREDAFPDPHANVSANLAARWGVPAEAVRRWTAQHGEAAVRRILDASISRPPVAVRPRRGRDADVEAAFTAAGIAFEREGPCLLLRGAGDVRSLPLWDEHAIAVQDPTAADAVLALGPLDGLEVLDVCAAPGGKTLLLSESAAHVTAVDVPGPRTETMRAELERRGVTNVEVIAADATRADALPHGPLRGNARGFDVVFVDAPCTNSGVLSKRVEARRRLRDGEALASLAEVQSRLFAAAATRVAPGGRLVWSTCSIDAGENSEQVRRFVGADPDFRMDRERTTLPVAGRRDGGYTATVTRLR